MFRRRRWIGVLLMVTVLTVNGLTGRASADGPVPGTCDTGVLPSNALMLMCVPAAGWNGDLVVFAHGYVPVNAPLGFYHLDFAEGSYLPDVVQGMGYAFATTSYRQNGLAILEGQEDIRQLVVAFHLLAPRPPARTFLVGASEGGIVTALLLERSPQLFAGGIAACAPIGSFQGQIDHIGDFRVLFDVLFPGVLPGSATRIPTELIANWDGVYAPRIRQALVANALATGVLVRMSRAAVDPGDPSSVPATVLQLLWYNVFGTTDAAGKLGGNPYGNLTRVYSGSGSPVLDGLINAAARRVAADRAARDAVRRYETSGLLTRPLVAPHTTGDDVVPFWHQVLYLQKLAPGAPYTVLPVERHGHCRFTPLDLIGAFSMLLLQVGPP